MDERVNFNQPMCDSCWEALFPDTTPVRIQLTDHEICAWCGELTDNGIYVRAAPESVRFPAPND